MSPPHKAQFSLPCVLPPEIVREIAVSTLAVGANISSLKQYCLVNTTFRNQFQPFIFQRIDIEDSNPHWVSKKNTNIILDSVTRNPNLARNVKTLTLNVFSSAIAADPCIPDLLDQLSSISTFRFLGSSSHRTVCTIWGSLSPRLQEVIVKICNLSTIRTLYLDSVTEIPHRLIENPDLKDMAISNFHGFSKMGTLHAQTTPSQDNMANTSDLTPSFGPFASLETFTCEYGGHMPHGWIRDVIENPSISTRLQNLSLLLVYEYTEADMQSQFTPSFSISELKNLRCLRIGCAFGGPSSRSLEVIRASLKFANDLIDSVDGAASIEELRVNIGNVGHVALTHLLSENEWARLVAISSSRPSLKKIKIKFRFAPPGLEKMESVAFRLIKDVLFARGTASGILLVLKSSLDETKEKIEI